MSAHIPGQEPLTDAMLAQASPEVQTQMLGERLYPLIKSIYPELAAKITGMLLEMDNSELLHILKSQESLKSIADEAVAVLQKSRSQESEPLTDAMLAQASPEVQTQMLGERLYPLVKGIYPELAGKLTGMLLELDNSELLYMLESPESLKHSVDEAAAVLHAHQAK